MNLRERKYILVVIGIVVAAPLLWWVSRSLYADFALRRAVETSHALQCERAAEYLKQAVAHAEHKATPWHIRTVDWCFLHKDRPEDGRRTLNALEQKIRAPLLKGTVLALRANDTLYYKQDCQSSLAYAQQAISIWGNNRVDPHTRSEAYRILGASQLCLEQLENARSSFQNVLDLHPQNQFVLNAMGLTVYRIMGEDASAAAAAEEYFVRSFEADPAYWYPLFNLLSLRHADISKNAMYAERFLTLYEQLGTLPPILTLPTLARYPEFVYVMYAHNILAYAYVALFDRRAIEHYGIAQSIFERHRAEIAAIEGLHWPHQIAHNLERVRQFFAQ